MKKIHCDSSTLLKQNEFCHTEGINQDIVSSDSSCLKQAFRMSGIEENDP